jgi:hypothetical protein
MPSGFEELHAPADWSDLADPVLVPELLEGLQVRAYSSERWPPPRDLEGASAPRVIGELRARMEALEDEVRDLRQAVFGDPGEVSVAPGQAWIAAHQDFVNAHPMMHVAVDLVTGEPVACSADALVVERAADALAEKKGWRSVFTFFTSFVAREW